jgi:hypothetical protein
VPPPPIGSGSSRSGTPGGGAPGASPAQGGAAPAAYTAAQAQLLQARSVRVSRTRFSMRGPKAQRGTVIRFRLRKGGRVELVVRENSAPCSILGRKRVRGHEGMNRVRFDGRIRGKPLAAGRYTITVVVVRAGKRTSVGAIGVEVVPNGRRLTRGQRTAPVAPAGCFPVSTPLR